jgi:hypothetical protein
LDRTDLITTHMRSTFFAEWLTLWWEKRDGEGYLRLPFGEGRRAPLAAVDQSRVIAAMLLDPEPHNRRAASPSTPSSTCAASPSTTGTASSRAPTSRRSPVAAR